MKVRRNRADSGSGIAMPMRSSGYLLQNME